MIARKIFIILGMALLLLGCGSSKEKSYVNPYTSEVLDGMFQLRLGMSEAEIIEIISKSPKAKYEYPSYSWYRSYSEHNKYEKLVKQIRLINYTPMQGFTITNVELFFFEDKLFEMDFYPERYDIKGEDVNYKMLQELLTEKYGNPKEKKVSGVDLIYKPYAERTSEYDRVAERNYRSETTKRWMTNTPNINCYYYYNTEQPYSNFIKIINTDIEPQLEERVKQKKGRTRKYQERGDQKNSQ